MSTGTEAAARPRPFALVAAMPMAVLASLVAGLVVLGVLFHAEAAAAVHVWLTSTAYSHGFFVLPIALWLAWERRFELARAPVAPAPWAVLLAVPLGVAWFAAERLGLMEGRQLIAVGLVDLLFLAVLGWRLAWAFSAPLLYLFFLVPFGAFFVPALQDVTTWFIVTGLDLLGIPNFTDGYTIDTPAGSFYVAEACAGLRFLIASIAFGVLYACLIYRSVRRRAAFMLASVVIPIIANGLRGLGIVVLGQVLGSAQAAAADHILYGWIFFSIVILLLILAGLPFREDGTAPAAPAAELPAASKLRMGQLAAVMAGLLAVVACGPVAAALLDRAGPAAPSVTAMPDLVPPPGCVAGAAAMAGPRATSRFACGGATLAVTVETFPPRASPAALFTARREIAGESGTADIEISTLAVPTPPHSWRLVETEEPAGMTATALWIDAQPSEGGLADRLRLARNSLGLGEGGGAAPVLVAVRFTVGQGEFGLMERQRGRQLIQSFLAAQPGLSAQIAALSVRH